MKMQAIVIAVIAVIIVLTITGCVTSKQEPAYQLMPSQAGLVRFNAVTGETSFLISTPAGMRWIQIPESEVEVILVPDTSGSPY